MNPQTQNIAFIGGGNMANAIVGGLLRDGMASGSIDVIEPSDHARERMAQDFGVAVHASAGPVLSRAAMVVWAVKPQMFEQAAVPVAPHTAQALHLSVAAGIPSCSIARWLGCERVIRTMPNTPALIGKGITGVYARAAVTPGDRAWAGGVLATMGEVLWIDDEAQLDAVTALSGSGPAYVFYFLEAMTEAGQGMGLSRQQAYRLAVSTFIGAGELARASDEPPQELRSRVTSKGGTTFAAISAMDRSGLQAAFGEAIRAAYVRAGELGREFGET